MVVAELDVMRARDPTAWAQRVIDMTDIYHDVAADFRRQRPPIPEMELPHDR